ncbi:MAG: hypothetical protein ACK44E_00475, partial [Anaerolineales bacterium]
LLPKAAWKIRTRAGNMKAQVTKGIAGGYCKLIFLCLRGDFLGSLFRRAKGVSPFAAAEVPL